MVSRKAGSPGRSRISRKAIAWGRPACCQLNLYARGQHILLQHACETAGAARTRSSPRPLHFRRVHEMENFGRHAPRERERMSHNVIASEAKQSSKPRKERLDCFATLAMTKAMIAFRSTSSAPCHRLALAGAGRTRGDGALPVRRQQRPDIGRGLRRAEQVALHFRTA